MKKIITLTLALLMVLACLVACDSGDANDDTTVAETTEAIAVGDTTAADTTAKAADTTKKAADTTKAPATTTTAEPETTAAPAVEIPVVSEGIMVYYEDFDSYANTEGNDAVMTLLDWKIMMLADGAIKDNTATYFIKDGTFGVLNYDGGNIAGGDSYISMLSSEYMAACGQSDYTLQYDVKYIAAGDASRYIVVLLNYDYVLTSYNSFHLRIRGTANNQIRFMTTWYTYDAAGDFYAADTDDADGTTTVLKKLTGLDYDGAVYAVQDKSITVRYQANYAEGPTVYLRDNSLTNAEFICVSKPDSSASGYFYWNEIESYAVALKIGGKIDGFVDNIAIWTGLGDIPTDVTTTTYETAIAAYLAEVTK